MNQKKILQKILIIDDDEDILAVAKYTLNIIPGLTVTCAASGEEGLKKALELEPDLILLDLMMPDMDGMATLKAIQLLPSISHTPIVFFTARVQPQEIEEYLKLGILDVIVKPFDPAEFPNRIQNLWDKYCA